MTSSGAVSVTDHVDVDVDSSGPTEAEAEAAATAATAASETTTTTTAGAWIGVDLGTSNCSAAVWDSFRGHPKWMRLGRCDLANRQQQQHKAGRIVPSVVLLLTRQAANSLHVKQSDCQDVSSILSLPKVGRNENNNENENNDIVALVGAAVVTKLEEWSRPVSATKSHTDTNNNTNAIRDYSPAELAACVVTSVKRVFGMQLLSNVEDAVQEALALKLVQQDESVMIEIHPLGAAHSLLVSPVQIAAILLQSIRLAADDYLIPATIRKKSLQIPAQATVTTVRNCVVGVPAHYGRRQRALVVAACRAAGWDGHVSTVTESTAAAMAYGLFVSGGTSGGGGSSSPTDTPSSSDDKKKMAKTILVFDMGGGTTDVTIAEMTAGDSGSDEDQRDFCVVVTEGDPTLGGDGMDAALLHQTLDRVREQDLNTKTSATAAASTMTSIKLSHHERRSLLQDCKRAKELVCGDVDGGMAKALESYDIHFQGHGISIAQQDLETAIRPCLDQVRALVEKSLQRYAVAKGLDRSEVQMQEVILIGGATRVPAVRQLLREIFPPPTPPELCYSLNAMSAVSQGAAIKAAMESKLIPLHELRSAMMLDAVPHAIGVSVVGGNNDEFVEILRKDASLPANGYATFQLANAYQAGVTVIAVEDVGENLPFSKLGDFTFLLHKLTEKQRRELGDTRSVDIGMTLKENGEFVVSIFDENDPEHVRKKERHQRMNGSQPANKLHYKPEKEEMTMELVSLIVACIILFFVYVAVKLLFQEGDQLVPHEETP
jgi:molecular chaperone DnaK (HSP70)